MKLVQEFKTFINRGNIIDLSVAVIIGGAFGKIVTSMTRDIIMPVLSLITGEQGFDNYKYVITEANDAEGIAENAIYYGIFLQNVLDFLLIALVIFFFVRLIRKANEAAEKAKEELTELKDTVLEHTKVDDVLLEIKDMLQKNNDN